MTSYFIQFLTWDYLNEPQHAGSSFHCNTHDLDLFEEEHAYEIEPRWSSIPYPVSKQTFELLQKKHNGTFFCATSRSAKSLKRELHL